MKLIFLDMDGVVNTVSDKYCVSLDLHMETLQGYSNNRCPFDPRLIFNFIKLLEFCTNNNIKIVISSTWRMGTTVEDWNNFFNKHFGRVSGYKLDNLVIGLTPVDGRDRGKQIQTVIESLWLVSDANDTLDYIIVDDDIEDITPYHDINKIVKVDPIKGLNDEYLQRIFDKFKGDDK